MAKWELIHPVPEQKDPDDLLEMHDIAKMLAVDISWVKNHCTRTEPILPHVKLGDGRSAKRRFKRSDILNFIEEHMVPHSRPKPRL